MFQPQSRRGRLLTVLVGLVVVIAIVVVDSVTIAHRRHQEAVAAGIRKATARRVAYLAALRGPLADVYVQTQPLQNALETQVGGGEGVDFPIRDALAHTSVLAALRGDLKAVQAAPIPVDLKVQGANVVSALSTLVGDVGQFPAEASLTGEPLGEAFESGPFADFQDAETPLSAAIQALYDGQHEAEPPQLASAGGLHGTKLGASHDSWLFLVDRACLVANNAFPDFPKGASNTQIQDSDQAAGSDLVTLAAAATAVPLPSGDTAARRIASQLPLISQQGQLLQSAAAKGRAGDIDGANAAVDQAAGLGDQAVALGKLFGSYGAETCADFLGAGSVSSGSGSGGSGGGGGSVGA